MKNAEKDGVKIGDIVTSFWNSHGVEWEVINVYQPYARLDRLRLEIRSVKTGRVDVRQARDMRIVRLAEVDHG